ncbi:MerR family transcriptional regulator [Desulfovirgula thermocuniculi]|uniref:MerR family transcriptional regulator n=1 Tax=Desulfovirgula thermocuniculi TaxID=348842 RepID=UPI00041F2970|nr:MerR family DNA-binding transcriptional regulator [Desulfovirgula thermocuniculi]
MLKNSSKKEEKLYTISELAQEFGVTTRTIRYYEEVGLLAPRRDESGQRLYTRRDRARLKLILRGKRFGFSLQEIKEMLDLYDVDPTQKEQLKKTIEYGERRIAEIEEMIRDLQLLKEEMLEYRNRFLAMLEELEGKKEVDPP